MSENQLSEAICIIRNELLKHGDLYNGYFASIKSAINDMKKKKSYFSEDDLTEVILSRIIGED